MEFINLGDALTNIADCINPLPPFGDEATDIGAISRPAADEFWKLSKIEWAQKLSRAALALNNALHHSDAPLQWLVFDERKRFAVRADDVKQEGIELLTHATGWRSRKLQNYSTHFLNAITQGDAALSLPVIPDANDGITPDGQFVRLLRIGFDRGELAAFLDANEIDHSLQVKAMAPGRSPTETDIASGVDWRNVVRSEAWEQWVKTLAENGTPTLGNVANHLAYWCVNNHVNGTMGKPPTAGYIKTHVIGGHHWEPPRHMSREAAKKHLEQKKQEKPAN